MKIELNKNELAGALVALGKLICRTSPNIIYKAVQIESKQNEITFKTCNQEESIEFRMEAVTSEEFCICVNYELFRVAVRGCRNKMITLEYADNRLTIDGAVIEKIECDYPALEAVPNECQHSLLPDNFVELLSQAAPLVNRNDYRKVLQGINLSKDGITATNGKELYNVASALEVASLTIPFPLALMATKANGPSGLFYWSNGNDTLFKVCYTNWTWTAKALSGMYPNWKQIVPKENELQYGVDFSKEQAQMLMSFLKQLPDDPPNNAVCLTKLDNANLSVESEKNHLKSSIHAEFTGDWKDYSLHVNKNSLMRLLIQGHTHIGCSDSHAPFMASGGTGMYIAMPLYSPKAEVPKAEASKPEESTKEQVQNEAVKAENTNEPPSKKEKEKMIEATTIPSVPMQNVTPNNEPNETVNPMDDLTASIESFKLKLKVIFDESNALSRKVKEVQLAQKQKERDFILARKAIERIRMVSSF